MLSCEHCKFHRHSGHVEGGHCAHPKVELKAGYCTVERGSYGKFTTCGPHGKLFEPAPEHVLRYHASEEYLFAKNPLAFWLDPARWDDVPNPNLRDPDGTAFWMS